LILKYGREKANVIISNLGNQFFGRSVEKNTAQMITQLFGRADKSFQSISKGDNYHESKFFGKHTNSQNQNITESVQERDRVKISDIMNLQPGEFYGFIAEGNQPEVFKTRFLMNDDKIEYDFKKTCAITSDEIYKNYLQIIEESKSILSFNELPSTHKCEDDDLIKF
jgi:type IV secretory pathway TraG/TraD family ATPase VirD4